MDSTGKPVSITFETLPEDCIRLIVDEVVKLPGAGCYASENIKNLSRVNQHLRELCLPLLFPIVRLPLSQRSTPSLKTFRALLKAPFVTTSLVSFSIGLSESPETPHKQAFYDSFVRVLSAMPNLCELGLSMDNDGAVVFKLCKSFRRSMARFPNIQTLELRQAPNVPDILLACPLLKTLIVSNVGNMWREIFLRLPSMKALRKLEVDFGGGWQLHRVTEIIPYIKNITELCIKGMVSLFWLEDYAIYFSGLEKLTSLSVVSAKWLDSSYICWHFTHERYLPRRIEEVDGVKIAREFFTVCPSLVTFQPIFSFYGTRYDCERKAGRRGGSRIRRIRESKAKEGWEGFSTMSTLYD